MFEGKTKYILAGALVVIAGIIWWGLKDGTGQTAALDPSAIVYYYGAECPHCKDLQAWIDANKIADKVSFVKKEVWHDSGNASELANRAKACGIQPEGMGVPFIYGGDGMCYVGAPDAEKFFSEKAGIEAPVQPVPAQ